MTNEIETIFHSYFFILTACISLQKIITKRYKINWVISTYCQSNLSCQIFPKLNRRLVWENSPQSRI
uniref:Putative ovule protein n=1 Tax=Solanum chacoense TaxID=4108 RepID=A0A0V0HUW9_SOLCH